MSSSWPDGWISATLDAADLPITDYTKTVIQKWQESTPILSYTNNPLGMPVVKGVTSELMRTGYAMFPTMPMFRTAFANFINSAPGRKVHDALALGEKYAPMWRAIHALPWPAASVEEDWPIRILDLMSDSVRMSLETAGHEKHARTAGAYGAQTAYGELRQDSARSAAQAASVINEATRALPYIFRGVK